MRVLLNFFLCCALGGVASAKPAIINDSQIIRNFQKKAGAFAEAGEAISVQELQNGLKSPTGLSELDQVEAPEQVLDSVFVVGAVYDCGKCDQWHPSGLATAWVMASDGILCTNHHVIKSFKGEAMAVASWKGEVYPVTEILLADEANDFAVIRVDAEGLVPLPIASEAAQVGEEIFCLSHPQQRFFHRTFGEVARYHYKRAKGPKVAQMSITADYAKGSSGGPILNLDNEVVGMVSTTNSVYAKATGKQTRDNLQMVFKSCVPGFVMQELLDEGVAEAAEAFAAAEAVEAVRAVETEEEKS